MLIPSFTALFLSLLPLAAIADATIPEADLKGATDPVGLGRYEGSFIVDHQMSAFDDISLPLSVLERVEPERTDGMNNAVYAPKQKLDLEGRLTRVVYLMPPDRSQLEVVRNYAELVKAKGGQTLYECKAETCGGDVSRGAGAGGGETGIMNLVLPASKIDATAFSNAACAVDSGIADPRFFVGAFTHAGAETHVAVYAYAIKDDLYCKAFDGRTVAIVVTVEAKVREQKMVAIAADSLAAQLDTAGRIALYGIYFDFDKADVKQASRPQLDEIATLMKNAPALRLDVVGHTDDKGTAAYNVDLSTRRANSVVAALEQQYGVAPGRLVAQGKGSSSPLVANDNDEARAKNRRVELVKSAASR